MPCEVVVIASNSKWRDRLMAVPCPRPHNWYKRVWKDGLGLPISHQLWHVSQVQLLLSLPIPCPSQASMETSCHHPPWSPNSSDFLSYALSTTHERVLRSAVSETSESPISTIVSRSHSSPRTGEHRLSHLYFSIISQAPEVVGKHTQHTSSVATARSFREPKGFHPLHSERIWHPSKPEEDTCSLRVALLWK